jgi:hypothetical protein
MVERNGSRESGANVRASSWAVVRGYILLKSFASVLEPLLSSGSHLEHLLILFYQQQF